MLPQNLGGGRESIEPTKTGTPFAETCLIRATPRLQRLSPQSVLGMNRHGQGSFRKLVAASKGRLRIFLGAKEKVAGGTAADLFWRLPVTLPPAPEIRPCHVSSIGSAVCEFLST